MSSLEQSIRELGLDRDDAMGDDTCVGCATGVPHTCVTRRTR